MSSEPLFYDKHIANILKALLEKPRRYVDLESACLNEHTRADKLRLLEKKKLIKTGVRRVGKRNSIFYEITAKGKEVIELIERIDKLLE